MPRTFLVRRAALHIESLSSTDSEEDTKINPELNVNLDSVEKPLDVKVEPKSDTSEQSPTYLSKVISSSLRVDTETGAIENNTPFVKEEIENRIPFVKEEIGDTELDAEVAYHTDKSFTSSISGRQSCSRPLSILSDNHSLSRSQSASSYASTPNDSLYSDVTEQSFNEQTNTLSLPVITPHQPLPPFASLAYNVFVSSKIMGESTKDTTVTMNSQPNHIIKLPLRVPVNGEPHQTVDTVQTPIKADPCAASRATENAQDDKENTNNSTKSAPKIWNPFHHVATPKVNKVLPTTSQSYSPSLPSPHLLPGVYLPIQTQLGMETTPQRSSSERSQSALSSPFQSAAPNVFQTVPQINSSLNFSPVFSPNVTSPFLPYRPFCESYQHAQSNHTSRTSTPSLTPLPTTPRSHLTELHNAVSGQKRPCTPLQETPKRIKIDNIPFQIYKESPSPISYDRQIQAAPFRCTTAPILVNPNLMNQENRQSTGQSVQMAQPRPPLQPMTPGVLGSASKENVQNIASKDTALKVLNTQQKLEVINGGYGIKNPAFVPPRPADITNIQQDESGNGNFACKVCGKEFTIQRLLNRHLKCHSENKRYLCTFCGKGFNDTFDLKRHTRIHTGVKPYKCEHCEKAFTQRCSLESHSRKVHNMELSYGYKQRRSKTYVCEDCGHSTTDPEVHYNHLKERHPNCPALSKPHDKRHFKFQESNRPSSGPLRPRN